MKFTEPGPRKKFWHYFDLILKKPEPVGSGVPPTSMD
jgi:hypothetical protein